jgi:adenylosuccinate lyase
MRRKPKTSKDKRFEKYQSPLVERYASEEMSYNFSDKLKYSTWRKLWIALAETQRNLGVKTITKKQIEEMIKFRDRINFDVAKKHEISQPNLRQLEKGHVCGCRILYLI